jgi:hypothetical protein
VNYAEQPPSERWAALSYRGERFAEVWFKPEGEPFGLMFRIPRQSFHLAGIDQRLTIENLLKAVGLAPEQVESWRHGDVGNAGMNGANPELRRPLPAPPEDADELSVHICLKPPEQHTTPATNDEPEVSLEQVQDLEARWNAILVVESAIDQLRLRVESAQAEMEGAAQRMLTMDEKLNALNADVLQWTKAKGRARFASPKAKEFVHRATWLTGDPERKSLGEIFKDGLHPGTPASRLARLPEELARLLKHHQVMSTHGGTVYQECKTITADIQAALRTLLNNSAANAQKKRVATHKKGKYV